MKIKFIDRLGNKRMVRNCLVLEQLVGITLEKDKILNLEVGEKSFQMKVILLRENEAVLKSV
jgi:hypothetical protein